MNTTTKKSYKILALMGPSGSGKDTVLKEVLKKNPKEFNKIINCTTRPMREGEVDGVDYFFISPETFAEQVLNFDMIEATNFNDWFYGTSKSALVSDIINIGVFSPEAVEALLESPDIELMVLELAASDKTRLLRQLNREVNPNVHEIIRRFKADEEDFADLDILRITLVNETKDDLLENVYYISRLPRVWAD
jgi:guanylate kinase